MFQYLLVLSFIMFWIMLEKKVFNRKAFWIPLLVLALFAGVRSYGVGTDSTEYVRNFINHLDPNYFNFRDDLEFGYQLLEYSLLHFTHNYFWLFFITALLIVFCYLKIIKKYSVNYYFSVFLFFTLGTYTFFFNGLRQGLAMAIVVLSTPYIIDKKIIRFIVICFIATLFHISALVMIPFYFLVRLRVKIIYKCLAVFLISLLGSGFLVSYVATTQDRYEAYADVSEAKGGLLILTFYVILMIFLYSVSIIYKIKDDIFLKLLALYMCGISFVIPIAMLSATPSGPQRLLNYFTWTLILLLPVVLKKINNIYVNIAFILLVLTYFILTLSRFSNLTPYMINPIFEIFI